MLENNSIEQSFIGDVINISKDEGLVEQYIQIIDKAGAKIDLSIEDIFPINGIDNIVMECSKQIPKLDKIALIEVSI
jgi:hypothetical protein